MKRFICFVAILVQLSNAGAMSFGGLEHEIHFAKNSSEISTEEVRSLVDWKIKTVQFGGIDYAVFVKKDDRFQITLKLAEHRRDAIVSLMSTLGIQVTDTDIEDLNLRHKPSRLTQEEISTAIISVQPPCTKTHDCGLQPIPGWKPAEQNK
ncbi:hypothetical protein [Collimonas silvisoli]|uniref:hypothetical protein n=1 Tax=Collimonas silvisoli TaxID=2825884 RepID=UPI001B8C3AC2|nr:hypothetical protein [Collimonas silvisoli]